MASKPTLSPAKAKTAANAITVAVALIVIIVGLNIVASRVFGRLDITEDGIYKLSESSRATVANLPDTMTARAYISSGLQPPLNQYGRYVRDLLDEYAMASKGKFQWQAIDPFDGNAEEKAQKKEDLTKYKIQKITLERISEAKLEIGSDNYLGIGFQYGGEIQSLPMVTGTEGLEYQITSIIKHLVSAKKKKIAFATSEGELSPSQGMQIVGRILQDYETTTVTLDKPLADDIDMLVIAGPKQQFNDKAKRVIDEFLMKGKSVALFLQGMVIEAPNGMMNIPGMEQPKLGRGNNVGLQDLLDKYGVKVREDLVLDDKNTMGPVPVGGQMYLANYPAFVAATDDGLSDKLPITSHIKLLITPFTSSLELVGELKDNKVQGVTAVPVAKSSSQSWRQTGFFMFNPQVAPQRTNDVGPFVLGYALEGKIKSAYAPLAGDPNVSTPDAKPAGEAPAGTRLLVMGNVDMISDQSLPLQQVPLYRSNLLFLLNTIDWLVHDESLISLRAKGMGARPLTVNYDGKVKFLVIFNVVGIPIILIALGIILWRVRVLRRRAVQL